MHRRNTKLQKKKKKDLKQLLRTSPKLVTDTKAQNQEAQRTPSWINVRKMTPRPFIFKLQKINDNKNI